MKENNEFPISSEEWLNDNDTIIIVDEAQERGTGRTDFSALLAKRLQTVRQK